MSVQVHHTQDYFLHKRCLNELLRLKDDDCSGYVEGKVFMIWPPRNRLHRVNIEVVEDSALYRFEVEVPHKDGLKFRPHERVCVALKGMEVVRRKESSAPHYFPIALRFPNGVILKYLSGLNAGKVVDTWEGSADEWYNPGAVRTVSDAVSVDASEIYHSPVLRATCPSVSNVNQLPSSIPILDKLATGQLVQPAQRPSTDSRSGGSFRVRQRKKRKLLREKEKRSTFSNQQAVEENILSPPDTTAPRHEQPQISTNTSSIDVSGADPRRCQVSGHTNAESSAAGGMPDNIHANVAIIVGEAGIPSLQLKAGFRTQRGDVFTSLSELRKGHSMINVIGIAVHVIDNKTSTNEWCRSITLADPSTIDLPRQGIKVNCFQKKYLEWLPQVQKDDIIILRKLKVVEFNGIVTATGYGDKLRWAVYDLLTRSIRPPKKGDAPEKELMDGGMGYEYSPYWEPFEDSTEIEYCQKIGEWWKALCTLKREGVVEIGCSQPRRRHLLISEASPDLPPDGFFDCTVEVLRRFDNSYGAATVYVTDYTTNALVHTVQATWCPSQLSDRVLQCNLWDSARGIARMMNPGEYWYLHNVRARWNHNHYMEGTLQDAKKVTQLDEAKLETQPRLKALLGRKKEFQTNHSWPTSTPASMHVFPEMLLQDVDENTSFLTCIVALLHIDLNSRDGHFLYATDYTFNPGLPTSVSTADWARHLEHRVVKIRLDDTQAKLSSDVTSGSTYIIRNMRIRRSSRSDGIHGCLGGDDPLIISLHDLSCHQAQELQRNKEKWERENTLNDPTISLSLNWSYKEADMHRKWSSALWGSTTLREALAWPAPNEFKVSARLTDFFPFSLEDACLLRCTKCESSPPPSFQRCPRCDDMMETHCKWFYCLYVLLEDDKGNELVVSLSGKECALLQDVDPTDFRHDQAAFHKFLSKLDPILGNLRDVHLAWSRNEDKAVDSPLMTFTIESWNVGNEKGYGLLDCV